MAKKLISRQQQKPALKKVKKYSLAGYNLSGVSQALLLSLLRFGFIILFQGSGLNLRDTVG